MDQLFCSKAAGFLYPSICLKLKHCPSFFLFIFINYFFSADLGFVFKKKPGYGFVNPSYASPSSVQKIKS